MLRLKYISDTSLERSILPTGTETPCSRCFLQSKTKKPETKDPGGSEVVKDNALTPDTGQSPTKEQTDPQEEPQAAAAAASTCSPTTNNNNSSNYNLVTSLLNLTKSPVSETREITFRCFFFLFSFP